MTSDADETFNSMGGYVIIDVNFLLLPRVTFIYAYILFKD